MVHKSPGAFVVEIQATDRDNAAPFLHRRTAADFRKWSEVDHNKTGLVAYDPSTPAEEIFDANASCILAPDNANGPYFVSQELSKQCQTPVISFYKGGTCAMSGRLCFLPHSPIARLQLDEKGWT